VQVAPQRPVAESTNRRRRANAPAQAQRAELLRDGDARSAPGDGGRPWLRLSRLC